MYVHVYMCGKYVWRDMCCEQPTRRIMDVLKLYKRKQYTHMWECVYMRLYGLLYRYVQQYCIEFMKNEVLYLLDWSLPFIFTQVNNFASQVKTYVIEGKTKKKPNKEAEVDGCLASFWAAEPF